MASAPLSNPPSRPSGVRWLVFVLACGSSWMLYLHRYTFALIKPELEQEFDLSKTQLGLLDSAFSFCYSAFQFPSGVAADLIGAHIFLGSAILIWSVALGLHAWAGSLNGLWFARGLFGAAQSGTFASVGRVTRTWFPSTVRTAVQGWAGVFSGRMGGLSANLIFAFLLVGVFGLSWRTAIYLFAGLGLVHGALFLLFFRDSPRKHPWTNDAEADLIEETSPRPVVEDDQETGAPAAVPTPPRMTVREMFQRMSWRSIVNLLCLNLTSTMSTIADNIYSNWIPLFLADAHGLKFKEMGIYSALPLLGGAIGGATSGFLNDWLIVRTGNRRWTRSLIGLGGKGMAAVVLMIALQFDENPYRFCGFLFFVKFFADCSLATRWGTVTDISGRATASVFAFNNSVASIGAVLAPAAYGYVADVSGWTAVFHIACGAYVLCALSWLLVNCTIPLVREGDLN